jgi:integrase
LLVKATRGRALAEALEAAAGSQRPDVLDAQWPQVPQALQQAEWRWSSLPEELREAFILPWNHIDFQIDLGALPALMRRELAWCIWRFIDMGGRVAVSYFKQLVGGLADAAATETCAPRSLMDLTPRRWEQALSAAVFRRKGALPGPGASANTRRLLHRCYELLWAIYDDRPWWQREVWSLVLDPRIPRRPHEPAGTNSVYFHGLEPLWLRDGVQWYFKISLETGQLTWSTLLSRVTGLQMFSSWLSQREPIRPWLCDDPDQVRGFMLDYLGHLRTRTDRAGKPMSIRWVTTVITDIEQFYAFMHDNRAEAARALGDSGWRRLGPQHAVFWRRGEKGQPRVEPNRPEVIDETAMSQITANLHVLGALTADGGFADEQAMRAMMLVVRTGRRINEILMIDRDPLLPLEHPTAPSDGDGDDGAFVAKLHYQQTKIERAPSTIFVDAEIVAIIREQQRWVDEHLAPRWAPRVTPRYLFLGHKMNRNADRAYPVSRIRNKLTKLAQQLDIRDSSGRLVDFNRTHRFRHTKATSLLNAGVPLHVVQRYMGHLSPAMTMTYGKTLAETHEREFLRFRKVTADARDLEIDPRDLYDMLELDKRTDRILPNGWCLLPPRQVCSKGNACLTCEKFATDASFLPELTAQRTRTEKLIDERRAAFHARTGQELGEDNIWLAGRRQEHDALGRIMLKLEQTRLADGTVHALRGAGVAARTDAITREQGAG